MITYIEVKNGQPVNHPALEKNLLEAFGEIPSNWEPFTRVENRPLGEFEKFDDPAVTYEKVNGVWTDVFHIIPMSVEEKTAKEQAKKQEEIDEYKTLWEKLPQRWNFSAWVFNEATIQYDPPVPRPTGRNVFWHGAVNAWVDAPQKPNDGKAYRMDFETLSWVELYQPTE
jgi:hypothetical protein